MQSAIRCLDLVFAVRFMLLARAITQMQLAMYARLLLLFACRVWLSRHMEDRAPGLSNLPEDPPCIEALQLELVKQGDFRKGLKPGIDYTVHTKSDISEGTILGLYRARIVTKAEEKAIKHEAPDDFEGNTIQWRQILDAYTADIEQPTRGTKQWKQHEDIYSKVLQVCLWAALLDALFVFAAFELH